MKRSLTDQLSRYRKAGEASADAAMEEAARRAEEQLLADDPTDAEPVPINPHVAAFFDIDNTIMRGASIFHLARGAYQRDFLTLSDLLNFGVDQVKFLAVGNEDPQAMAEATEAALAFVKGRSVAEISDLGEEIYDQSMGAKIWPGTLDLARRHLDAGERVWLVSATPVELARVIGGRLGFTGALGTVSEVRDGRYTGRLVGHPLHGLAKAEAVRALAAREGLDLRQCYAYSDSSNDIPMLSTVGNPVAVNPDPELKEAARDNRWPIYDFRGRRLWLRYKLPAALGGAAVAGAAAGYAARAVQRSSR